MTTIKKKKEMDKNKDTSNKEICERCGNQMDNITACHLICNNCGANYDCSDKGSTR